MDKSGFRNFEGEVVALRHIASTLDLPHALKRHAELMTGVRAFGLDLLGMIEQEGVENACAHNTAGAPHRALIPALASRCAAALLPLVRTDAVRVRFIRLHVNDVEQVGCGVHQGRRVAARKDAAVLACTCGCQSGAWD